LKKKDKRKRTKLSHPDMGVDSKNLSEYPLRSQQMSSKTWLRETKLERAGKRQTVYNIVHKLHNLKVKNLVLEAEQENINRDELKDILDELRQKGLVYTPKPGFVGCVDD